MYLIRDWNLKYVRIPHNSTNKTALLKHWQKTFQGQANSQNVYKEVLNINNLARYGDTNIYNILEVSLGYTGRTCLNNDVITDHQFDNLSLTPQTLKKKEEKNWFYKVVLWPPYECHGMWLHVFLSHRIATLREQKKWLYVSPLTSIPQCPPFS